MVKCRLFMSATVCGAGVVLARDAELPGAPGPGQVLLVGDGERTAEGRVAAVVMRTGHDVFYVELEPFAGSADDAPAGRPQTVEAWLAYFGAFGWARAEGEADRPLVKRAGLASSAGPAAGPAVVEPEWATAIRALAVGRWHKIAKGWVSRDRTGRYAVSGAGEEGETHKSESADGAIAHVARHGLATAPADDEG